MNNITKHIASRIVALLLVVSLFVPAAAKLNHVFSHHKHQVCIDGHTTHIHKIDLDCDFHKFQLNKTFTLNTSLVELFNLQEASLKIISQYNYLSKYQRLHVSLRGPPALI